jgi:hypothetical protein
MTKQVRGRIQQKSQLSMNLVAQHFRTSRTSESSIIKEEYGIKPYKKRKLNSSTQDQRAAGHLISNKLLSWHDKLDRKNEVLFDEKLSSIEERVEWTQKILMYTQKPV